MTDIPMPNRTGLRPWPHDPHLFKLGALQTGPAPKVPNSHRRELLSSQKWKILGNDQYGDCYFAGQGHYEMLINKVQRHKFTLTDQQVIDAYMTYTGGSDDGTDPLEALRQWRRQGLWGRPPIKAFLGGDPSKFATEIPLIDFVFGTCGLAFALPNAIQRAWGSWPTPPADWQTNPDWAPWSWGGHYVITHGYNMKEKWIEIVTWGQGRWRVPFAFCEAYLAGTFAVITPEWFNKAQKTPQGFDTKQLDQWLGAL